MEEFTLKEILRHRKLDVVIGVIIVGVCAGVGWVVGGAGQGDDSSRAILWTTLFTMLGFALILILEVMYRVTRAGFRNDVDIIRGQDELIECFRSMRKTEKATLVEAIWSIGYTILEPQKYFGEEFTLLEKHDSLTIYRLINPDSVEPQQYEDYCAAYRDFIEKVPSNIKARYRHGYTDVAEFECFVVIYHVGTVQHVKSLFVFNDEAVANLPLGLYIDSRRSTAAAGAAATIKSWFDNLVSEPEALVLVEDKRGGATIKEVQYQHNSEPNIPWDDIAAEWDTYVTRSNYPDLVKFMDEEERLLALGVKAFAQTHPNMVVVEIGSGTGRSLFNVSRVPEIMAAAQYLIGIDSADSMTRRATSKSQELSLGNELSDDDAKKFVFLTMEAARLDKSFRDGALAGSSLGGGSFALIDPAKYRESAKVVCIMLNTLGNMGPARRNAILKGTYRAMGSGDKIVVSVFDASAFGSGAPALYSHFGPLVGNYGNGDFDSSTHEFKPEKYYSHWFARSEAVGLLEVAGFTDVRGQTIANGKLFGFFFEAVKP